MSNNGKSLNFESVYNFETVITTNNENTSGFLTIFWSQLYDWNNLAPLILAGKIKYGEVLDVYCSAYPHQSAFLLSRHLGGDQDFALIEEPKRKFANIFTPNEWIRLCRSSLWLKYSLSTCNLMKHCSLSAYCALHFLHALQKSDLRVYQV